MNSDKIKSSNSYIFTLGGDAVTWKLTKQTIIAKSIIESEFSTLELVGNEPKWLRNLIFHWE